MPPALWLPKGKRKQERADAKVQASEDAKTFEVVARDWHANQLKAWSENHAAKVLARIEQHLFPAFGSVPITALRAPAILPTLREIEARGNNETAKRLRQYGEAVFAYVISTGVAERNVGADLRGTLAPCRVKNRPAIIDSKGVAQLLRAMEGSQRSPIILMALRRLGYEQGEMCAHGFRAMASTLFNELGWNSDLIERQLAHAERNSIRAADTRATYLPERRKMMQSYADYLAKLKAGAKVTPLHATVGE